MKDLSIPLTHRTGALAEVTNALSLFGVNLKTVAAMVVGGQGLLRIIPDDFDAARSALQAKSIPFEESDIVTVLMDNRAGELTGVAARLAEAAVNLLAVYVVGLADDMIELAVAVDDVKKAKKVLGELVS